MKLLLIGPSKAGKSVLASFLAGMLDSTTPAAEPPPTVGVRILELTCVGQAVELWDVSGDQSYENTWPAVQQGADGVIMCYSPETPGHAKELELFYEWFCVKRSVPAERCACFALSQSGAGGDTVAASAIGGVQPERFLLRADGGEGVRRAFERFVARLRGAR